MRSVRVGRAFGVDVYLDPSLLLLVTFLTWALFVRFEASFPGTNGRLLLAVGVAGGVLFLASVLVHELSHSLVAVRRGFTVRRIRLFMFGGISEIEQDAEHPGDEFVVAAAGPAASLLAGVLLVAVAWPFSGPIPAMIGLVGLMNLLLAAFNLLPGLPLDGGRMLRAALWRWRGDRAKATEVAVLAGRGVGVLLMLAGSAMILVWTNLAGLWILVVGWFLERSAAAALVRERIVERAGDATLRDVMRPVSEAAEGSMTVRQMLDRHGWDNRLRPMPVVIDGRVRGIVGDREINRAPPAERSSLLVADVMTPIGAHDVADDAETLLDFLSREASPARRVLVTNNQRVVGIVTSEEVGFLFE